jgi:lipopolysaccharide export system protein LptC
MTLDPRRLAIAAVLLGIAAGSWWLTRAVGPPAPGSSGPGARHEPDYTIEDFTTTVMNEQGKRRYTLSATLLVHYADDGSSTLTRPYLIQYREGEAPVYTRADSGIIPKDGSEIVMRGNVESAQGRDPNSAGGEIRAETMKILLDR